MESLALPDCAYLLNRPMRNKMSDKEDAEQDRRAQGKVDHRVLAAPGEVSRQAAEGRMEPAGEDQDKADQGNQRSGEQQEFSQVGHDISIPLKFLDHKSAPMGEVALYSLP